MITKARLLQLLETVDDSTEIEIYDVESGEFVKPIHVQRMVLDGRNTIVLTVIDSYLNQPKNVTRYSDIPAGPLGSYEDQIKDSGR